MTLFKQLAVLVSAVFILVLASVIWSDFRASSDSLRGQMQTVARDMATTLGIALANSERATDPAALETFFNAIFDSGYLAEVELRSPQGDLIHSKKQSIEILGVPEWFVGLVPFEPAIGEASVMSGWVQVGTLKITLHPGYAYLGTYRSLKSVSTWVLTIAIIGLVVLWWSLHLILRPLKLVRDQADAIHENRYIRQDELPRTKELRRVVQAMNRMVEKVQAVFEEQGDALNRYHEMLYRDELTGFGNRRELLARLDELQSDEANLNGHLAFIHVNGLSALSQRDGYAEADLHLAAFADAIKSNLKTNQREFATRVRPTEFAIYLERDGEDANRAVRDWFESFRATADELALNELWPCGGLVQLEHGVDTSTALAESDFVLTRAKTAGAYAIIHEDHPSGSLPKGRMQWRSFLQSCLEEQKFYLVAQPVVNQDGSPDHREVFVRLRDPNGDIVAAGMFMPMASALGLDQAIDLEVFRMALDALQADQTGKIAINLSASFCTEIDAITRLEQTLSKHTDAQRRRIHIEFRHFLLQQHTDSIQLICSKLKTFGYAIGIDNLDLSLPLDALQVIRPAYIKVNARVLADLAAQPGSAGLKALKTLTSGMGVRLIALGVDSKEVHEAVNRLGVDGVQGNFIAGAREFE